MNNRTDKDTALLIEAALNAAASHGVEGAAAELLEQGLSLETVSRVLYRPAERRRQWVQIDSMRYLPFIPLS